jgi:hypothetical protein
MTDLDGIVGRYVVLGLLLGIRHALEADHIAAVTALATRSATASSTARLAALWGAGHAIALAAAGSVLIVLDVPMPVALAGTLELAVGIMLIVVGADVLRRLSSGRVHIHAHSHDEGHAHIHVHEHAPAVDHDRDGHVHDHSPPAFSRAFVVGSIHGLAGSAALVLLLLQGETSAPGAFAALLSFGVGSVAGMVAFSLLIAWPLRFSVRRLSRAARSVEGLVGTMTVALGVWIAFGVAMTGGGIHH